MLSTITFTSKSRKSSNENSIEYQSSISSGQRSNCNVSRFEEHPCQLLSNWLENEDYQSREILLRLQLRNGIYVRTLKKHIEFYVRSLRKWDDDDKVDSVVNDSILANLKPGAMLNIFHNCGCNKTENCLLAGSSVTKLKTMLIDRYGTIKNESEYAKNYDDLTISESLVRYWLNVSRFIILDNADEGNDIPFCDETDHINCDEPESIRQFKMSFNAGKGDYYLESNTPDTQVMGDNYISLVTTNKIPV